MGSQVIALKQEVINGQLVTVKVLAPGFALYGRTEQSPYCEARESKAGLTEAGYQSRDGHKQRNDKYPKILELAAQGYSDRKIAEQLNCSHRTVARARRHAAKVAEEFGDD